MNKVIFGILFFVILGYLVVGVYYAQENVLDDPVVAKVKEAIENTKWKDICRLVEGEEIEGHHSYSYDCNGRVEKAAERMTKAIEEFQLRHSGVIIIKVPVRIYNRTWNDPALEPIRVYGIDFYWPFREANTISSSQSQAL